MIQVFKQTPKPLQKQILIRLGISLLFLVLLVSLLFAVRDVYLYVPCAGMALFYGVSAFLLFRRSVLGEYVIVSGKCVEIATTAVKHRAKHMILDTEVCKLKVMLHNRLCRIPDGASVKLYIAKNTQIFEQSGVQVLYNYITIEMK